MILFENDWEYYPNADIQTSTTNQSFIDFCGLLKGMGVKNYLFPLQIHNKDLIGINPHSLSLSYEEQLAVALEIKTNFYYYIREVVRVPGGTEEDPIQFRANRGNMALFWLFFNHITTILIQIRQTGKSFSTDTLMFYLLNFLCRKTEINLLTKDDTLRSSNLARLKSLDLELPYYLRVRNGNDVGNGEVLTVKKFENIYRGHLPNKSPKMAYNVGRGLVSPIFQIDEAAFFFNIAISLPAALAAGGAARDRARARGTPYGTILTTTAGKKDDRDGAYVFNMLSYSAVWNEIFYDAVDEDDLRAMVGNNAPKEPNKRDRNVRVNCTFNHRQLGYTDEWLTRTIQDSEAVGEDADRDFGNVWTSGSITSPLTAEQADLIRGSENPAVRHEREDKFTYIIRWHHDTAEAFTTNNSTVLTLDTSDANGGSGDDIGMVIRDVVTGAVVAAGNYNATNLIVFCQWLVHLAVKYPKIVFHIERRSTGAMIIDYLLLMLPEHGINPFRRIFNWVVQNADEKPEVFKAISSNYGVPSQTVLTGLKKSFGFATSAAGVTSRKGLYGLLKAAVQLTGSVVRDTVLINQLLALERDETGRIDHPNGGRDDMCIAWLLGFWLLTQGKNLDFYGINARSVLSRNDTNKVPKDPRAMYDYLYQEQVKKEITRVAEELSNERDELLTWRLEGKLRALSNQLNEEDREVLAIDDLIATMRESRRTSRSAYRY